MPKPRKITARMAEVLEELNDAVYISDLPAATVNALERRGAISISHGPSGWKYHMITREGIAYLRAYRAREWASARMKANP